MTAITRRVPRSPGLPQPPPICLHPDSRALGMAPRVVGGEGEGVGGRLFQPVAHEHQHQPPEKLHHSACAARWITREMAGNMRFSMMHADITKVSSGNCLLQQQYGTI